MLLPTRHSFRLVSKKDFVAPVVQEFEVLSEVQETLGEIPENPHKRSFLKLAGIAGVGLMASQMLPKKADAYVLGSTPSSSVVGSKDASNVRINPAKEDGNLATVVTNTTPLTSSSAGAYVRQDSTATIAKESGGNLAAIKANSDKFLFDGSGNLLTSGSGGSVSIVGLKDTTGTSINPATDDAIVYLRRMVKLMESQAAVDSANRQRITIDSLGTGTAVTTTIPVSGTVTASLSAGANAIGSITAIDGQGRQMFQDYARTAYATGIRQNLIFS